MSYPHHTERYCSVCRERTRIVKKGPAFVKCTRCGLKLKMGHRDWEDMMLGTLGYHRGEYR